MTKRRNLRSRSKTLASRNLHHETLEKRELLAAEFGVDNGPRLIAVAANSGEQFSLSGDNVLSVAPSQLTFRFDGAQALDESTLSAIRVIGSGGDGTFDDGNETIITPGFLGFEDSSNSRIVVARFAETLPDDQYSVEVAGFDDSDPNNLIVGLRNVSGDLFCPPDPSDPVRPVQSIFMNVEVGPRVLAVVPQPIAGSGTSRTPQNDVVHVYFNNDPLSNPNAGPITTSTSALSVVQPQYYQLVYTGDSIERTDDLVWTPVSVTYDPVLNRAEVTYSDDIQDLAPTDQNGAGTFRLRIGRGEAISLAAPGSLTAVDAGDTFADAQGLGVAFGSGTESVVVGGGLIQASKDITAPWPGAADVPGLRDLYRDSNQVGSVDSTTGINTFFYNFANLYGTNTQGSNQENAITPAQKDRAREVLGLYSERLGVEFIETENQGLQIVTGVLSTIAVSADAGTGVPYSVYRVNDADPTKGVLVLDAGENWYDGYGLSPDDRPSWFVESVRGVGSLLGMGNTFELPAGDATGGSTQSEADSLLFTNNPTLVVEPDFLTAGNVIAGQALHRPESNDVDFYSFTVNNDGQLSAEAFAQRLENSSLLDTHLTLYRVVDSLAGQYELVASNDDFFSDDSFIGVNLELPKDSNGNSILTEYVIGVSASGNDEYNGNVDGSGLGGVTEGSYELRITFVPQDSGTITDTTGTALDGDADGQAGGDFNFWFRVANDTATPAADEPRVIFVDKVVGNNDSGDGMLNSPVLTISKAFDLARPGDIVRLLPNDGTDGVVDSTNAPLAYEIGRGGSGNLELADGGEFEVPKGVTVMIDAGSILKLRSAKLSVGSESVDEDRSLAALQILGTPDSSVIFTSYDDASVGFDTNALNVAPLGGNWAGIEFRNDFDFGEGRGVWESDGIFLDYASHADIRYGGGSVSATQAAISPVELAESRPTLIYNSITDSAGAAISADPNSFRETNFHGPLFQRVAGFTSDYDRVGPAISGNTLLRNSTNGLFIRVVTPAVGQTEPMTVAGRLDDRDIVHVLSQVLVLQGQPGGHVLLEDRPDVMSVTFSDGTGGSPLSDGDLEPTSLYDYRLTYVTDEGRESLASLATSMRQPTTDGSIRINNLPSAPSEFSGRRLYRSIPGTSNYEFIVALDRGTASHDDLGNAGRGLLPAAAQAEARLMPRFDARLSVDPGLIIKLENARIEAGFGSDFYAEGTDGNPVVFTSRHDDTFGAGGTFDTNGSENDALPGDWGGLVFRQDSTASLDYVNLRFAGGDTPIQGGFADSNAVEILQADVRIAHSTFSENADGFSGTSIRAGRGFNGPGTIFVRGSQPIIVNNTIVDNLGAAISINPDALDFTDRLDHGRATGTSNVVITDHDNQGPLISDNQIDRNGVNGLLVRSEVLQTESVWDDTDIVHVVNGQIITSTHYHRGGLRLKSDANQSLVVKFGPNALLTGTGRPLDITDRIGGTLQVLGQPGFPVVMTSLSDDSVGAGFGPDGFPQNNTDGIDASPSPGDWAGIELLPYINDRNVAFVIESERAVAAAILDNATADDAQVVGSLAANEYSGDENERLGFNIRGTLASESDVDVYQFEADGGTTVFLDIDDTSYGLDTVIELIDINDNVLARSDNSFAERSNPAILESVSNLSPGSVRPLYSTGIGNVETENGLDAGMRVVLDGTGINNQYYVRVSSKDATSSGQYQLSIRLRETDEVAGSTIQLADIRFATDAITVSGAPLHSPLTGDGSELLNYTADGTAVDVDGNRLQANIGNATQLGNLLTSDRGSLRVSGTIGNLVNTADILQTDDIDVYQIDLFAQDIEADVFDSENRFVSATFDIDYADGLGRVNSSLAVFDSQGRLVLHSRDSSVADDIGRPLQGVDSTNLDGGSAGPLDAYIGPVVLPEGTYFVAVSSAIAIPEVLDQFFVNNSNNADVRLAPIDSVRRIAQESFDGVSFSTGYTADAPVIQTLFDETSVVPFTLDDVRLFVNFDGGITGNNQSVLASFNPFTGVMDRLIGQNTSPTADIASRHDGELFSFQTGPTNGNLTNANTGQFINISPATGASAGRGDDGLVFNENNAAGTDLAADADSQLIVNALAFRLDDGDSINRTVVSDTNTQPFVGIGNRDAEGRGVDPVYSQNIVYEFLAASGAVTSQGSNNANTHRDFDGTNPYAPSDGTASVDREYGVVDTGLINITGPNASGGDGGLITGIGYVPSQLNFNFTTDPDEAINTGSNLFGVTDRGGVHLFDYATTVPRDSNPAAAPVIPTTFLGIIQPTAEHAAGFAQTDFNTGGVVFTGMTLGPRQIVDGEYRQTMFATTQDGWLYGMEVVGGEVVPAGVFYNGNSAIPLVFGSAFNFGNSTVGFSPNGLAFSILEDNPWHITGDQVTDQFDHGIEQTFTGSRPDVSGGSSLYFGFEIDNNVANNTVSRADGDALGEISPGGTQGAVVSNPIDLGDYGTDDKPTLYFNYYLEVENDDDYDPFRVDKFQNDSFRVYAAGDDGAWQLLATNDSFRDNVNFDEFDEHQITKIPVQELFDDNPEWRQARVDLSPLAGNENVRLRFDFSTSGNFKHQYGAFELVAVDANGIDDRSIVSFDQADTDQFGFSTLTTVNFEHVIGRNVVIPNGSRLDNNDQVTLQGPDGSFTVTFVSGAALNPGEVAFTPTSTAAELASAVALALPLSLRAVADFDEFGIGTGVVSVLAATDVTPILDSPVVQSNPIRLTTDGSRLIVPEGVEIESGEQLEIFNFETFITTTIVLVDAADATGDLNEVVFAATDTSEMITDSILAALPDSLTPVRESANRISFLTPDLNFTLVPGPLGTSSLKTTLRSIDESSIPITVPTGDELVDGETLSIIAKSDVFGANPITITFTEGTATPAPGIVMYQTTDTAFQIAEKLLEALPTELQGYRIGDRELNLIRASSVSTTAGSSIVSFATNTGIPPIFGFPGTPGTPGIVPILIDANMTSEQVAAALQVAFAEGFGRLATADGVSLANAADFTITSGDRLRLYNVQPSFVDPDANPELVSPYGVSNNTLFDISATPVDIFGEPLPFAFATNQIDDQGAANNQIQGVYLDDIVIGFAERGEMVLNSPTNALDFLLNPETTPEPRDLNGQPERPNETLTGGYTLEVRTSSDYGVESDFFLQPINLDINSSFGRTFDTNDRLSGSAVTLITQAGVTLVDGDTFVIDNGISQLTFEFDSLREPGVTSGNVPVTFNPTSSDPTSVATAIREAINSAQAFGLLGILASTSDGLDVGESKANRVELFGDSITVNPGIGQFIKFDLVDAETIYGRETARLIPVVDHVTQTVTYENFGDQPARAALPGLNNGLTDVLVATGKIGDQVFTGTSTANQGPVLLTTFPFEDIDYVRIYLSENQLVDIDVDSAGFTKGAEVLTLPLITVFDQDQLQLAQSDLFTPSFAPGEIESGAFLKFLAPEDGYYDIAVSSGDFSFGEYQLTVRPDAITSSVIPARDVLMVDYHQEQGDINRATEQGQLIISSNFISDVSGFGIRAESGVRGQAFTTDGNAIVADEIPRPGSATLLRNVNTDALIPGAVISNNLIVGAGGGGIIFSGGTAANGQSPAAVPIGRIVNNTVVGTGSGSGISVTSNASPTILNNLISGFATGVDIDAGSVALGTTIGGNAYHNNTTNASVPLPASEILVIGDVFQDPNRRIFIPAAGSAVIDSSFSSLEDREEFFNTVKQPVGISESPIIAPLFDAYGQPRFNDPDVNPPGPGGSVITIDRGAIDRADRTPLVAVLTGPEDAIGTIVTDGDQSSAESFVRLSEGTVEFFEIQLLDTAGTGPDQDTITEQSVTLTENGRRLTANIDFNFGYSDNSNTIRLTPLAGLWRSDAVYEITLNNQSRISYESLAGGDINDGDQILVTDTSGTTATFEYDSGYSIAVPRTTLFQISQPDSGFVDGETFSISSPTSGLVTFEIELADGTTDGNVPVDLVGATTINEVRRRFLNAFASDAPAAPGTSVAEFLDLAPVRVGPGSIQLGTLPGHVITGVINGVNVLGQIEGIQDGETFSYDSGGTLVTFEFDNNGEAVTPGNVLVPFSRTNTAGETAEAIAVALRGQSLGLGGVVANADGTISVGGQIGDLLDTSLSQITAEGEPGTTADTLPVDFLVNSTAVSAAGSLVAAINRANDDGLIDVDAVSLGGGTILLAGAASLVGDPGGTTPTALGSVVPIITDLAGNAVRETRPNSETSFSIIMPDVTFDFGDAEASFGTLLDDDGARHTIGIGNLPRLGPAIDSELDGQPIGQDDVLLTVSIATSSPTVFLVDGLSVPDTSLVEIGALPTGGEALQVTIGGQMQTFELVDATSNPGAGNIAVTINVDSSLSDDENRARIITRVLDVMKASVSQSDDGVEFRVTDDGALSIRSVSDEDGIITGEYFDGQLYNVFLRRGSDPTNVQVSDIGGFLNPLDPAGTNIDVKVAGSGLLQVWIDFNGNGTFDNTPDEYVTQNLPVSGDAVDGSFVSINVVTPTTSVTGDVWMRMRISEAGDLAPTGVAVGGEVEDYLVEVIPVALPIPMDDAPYNTLEDAVIDTAADPLLPRLGTNFGNLGADLKVGFLPASFNLGQPPANGNVVIDSTTGDFVYTPNPDFFGTDTFTYRVSTIQEDSPATAPADAFATVTINVTAVNDGPTFTIDAPLVGGVPTLEYLEDQVPATIDGFAINIAGGPLTASDESFANDPVTFTFDPAKNAAALASGLLTSLPTLVPSADGSTSTLTLPYAPNGFGSTELVITATDSFAAPNTESVDVTFSLVVRPINDAPSVKPNLGVPASAQRNADDGYSVAANGVITYTLKEDNTGPMGAAGGPFFIPINTGTDVGYNRIGLLSIYDAGPSNEIAAGIPGANQVVSFAEAGSAPVGTETARRTDRGGLLSPVNDSGGNLIGYNYQPPTDFNTDVGGLDSFLYSVIDDNPLGGESYDPNLDAIVPFQLTTSNRVDLVLNPVNDRPVFETSTLEVSASEDSAASEIENYATAISAGPADTAFDEISSSTGQTTEFTLVSLDFPQADADDFFSIYPNIDEQTGLLAFQPAEDIFGDYRFVVTLNDDGPGNSTRGDLISSESVTLTIGIRPINDPPQLDPDADPLQFQINEDEQAVILVNGTATEDGLLDVFNAGPAIGRTSESADIAPAVGGNQTVSLRTPITNRSVEGGTIQFDDSGATPQLIYSPRPNFVGIDTFVYSVRDDGQSVDQDGVAYDDFRISSNTVTIVVAPVNDAPLFSGAGDVSTLEQPTLTDATITNWATNVQAGPTTAVDETDGTASSAAQTLEFIFNQVEGDAGLFNAPISAPIDPVTGTATLTYQTTPYTNGVAVFEVFLQDDGPGSNTAGNDPAGDMFRSEPVRTFTITVQSVNDPPQANLLMPTVTVPEDQGAHSVLQFDPFSPGPAEATDEQDQTVAFEVQALAPQFAQLFSVQPTIDDSGFLKFTTAPQLNSFNTGPVPVVVTARDSGGTSDGGSDATVFTFNIVITEVDDAPTAVADSQSTDEDTVLTFNASDLIANDIDPDLITNPNVEVLRLDIQPVFNSANGAVVRYDAATGIITYDPTDRLVSPNLQALMNDGITAETLTDTFPYSLIDSSGLTSNRVNVSIVVSGINDAPILEPDTPTLASDGTTVITPLANDIDIDGTIDPTSIQITLLPAFGSLEVQDDGTLIYTPFNNFGEEDVFRYTVADNFGLRSDEALITISPNASPIAVDDSAGMFVDESIFIDVAENDSDPNGTLDLDGITIVRTPLNGEALPQSDGTVQYSPDPGFVGIDTFDYRIADNEGRLSNVATARVQVVASRLQNPDRFSDVNADGLVTAIDALLIVNHIGRIGSGNIPVMPTDFGPSFFDVNGSQTITTLDALAVIQELERTNNQLTPEREQVFAAGLDVSVESRFDTVDRTEDVIDLIDSQAIEKLMDATSPSNNLEDAIDSIAGESKAKDSDSDALAVDEVLTGLF